MQIILPSREPARILGQFPHELSTTVFVLIKNVNFIVEYVQEKFYFSNLGRTNRFILPRITVYILKHATHADRAISPTFLLPIAQAAQANVESCA